MIGHPKQEIIFHEKKTISTILETGSSFYFFRKPEKLRPTQRKPEKNHKRSRLFKVVVSFQPLVD